MPTDFSKFVKINVTDTCSVWNILSSKILYRRSLDARCVFCCTEFVIYEALTKPRSRTSEAEEELKRSLRTERERGQFMDHQVSIDDLLDPKVDNIRNKFGKGELSSIAFAKKIGQAFLTDDKKARKLAGQILNPGMVQTVPHLLGWLVFSMYLTDSDIPILVVQHRSVERPLGHLFEEAYKEALRCRSMENIN